MPTVTATFLGISEVVGRSSRAVAEAAPLGDDHPGADPVGAELAGLGDSPRIWNVDEDRRRPPRARAGAYEPGPKCWPWAGLSEQLGGMCL